LLLGAALACVALVIAARSLTQARSVSATAAKPAEAPYTPAYNKDGTLIPPLQYREWVYLTSGLGMNYNANAPAGDSPSFDNVFVNPEAYRSFLANGTWPDKTVLVLEGRASSSKGSINRQGHFQSGAVQGLEVHIKDESKFPGKWAFFDVESETKTSLIPQTASCYSCHQAHAAVDTTFVQFYPTLLPVATQKGMLSDNYRKETAAAESK
jgi:hypothetical protein